MEKTIAPITAGQIRRAADRFSERCHINESSLPKDSVQEVLEDEGDVLAQEMFEVFRARVERHTNTIVRLVAVNRNRTPQEALDATGRKQYTDASVVSSMPKGEGDKAEIFFFKVGRFASDDELEEEFESRGFKPADPYSLAAVNEADPAFADEHPNGTHWKDAQGKWCYTTFDCWSAERYVGVYRHDGDWGDGWWFAGLRK